MHKYLAQTQAMSLPYTETRVRTHTHTCSIFIENLLKWVFLDTAPPEATKKGVSESKLNDTVNLSFTTNCIIILNSIKYKHPGEYFRNRNTTCSTPWAELWTADWTYQPVLGNKCWLVGKLRKLSTFSQVMYFRTNYSFEILALTWIVLNTPSQFIENIIDFTLLHSSDG